MEIERPRGGGKKKSLRRPGFDHPRYKKEKPCERRGLNAKENRGTKKKSTRQRTAKRLTTPAKEKKFAQIKVNSCLAAQLKTCVKVKREEQRTRLTAIKGGISADPARQEKQLQEESGAIFTL